MSSLDEWFPLMQSSTGTNKHNDDEKMKKYGYKIDKLIALAENIMHQNQNYSPEKVESRKAQVSDISYLVPYPFTAFTSSE